MRALRGAPRWLAVALLAACARPALDLRPSGVDGPPRLACADTLRAVRVTGEARGPLPGLGQTLSIEAWLRSDGWLRADLRYQLQGRPRDDVLIWTPDVAMVLDRRTGSLTMLGQQPGVLETADTGFRLPQIVWLALGRLLPGASASQWELRGEEWRGRMDDKALRGRPGGAGPPAWTELAWRDHGGHVRRMAARLSDLRATACGQLPGELSVEGTELSARAVVRWQIEAVPAPGDSLFDPLWRP